jgi:hypothetical protein
MSSVTQLIFIIMTSTTLSLDFLKEVHSAILRIIEFPKAFPILSKNTRRCLLNRFPFAVIYETKQNEIIVLAIMHLSRKPGYWKERSRT